MIPFIAALSLPSMILGGKMRRVDCCIMQGHAFHFANNTNKIAAKPTQNRNWHED
jgi:hypothetical protein